MTRCKYWTTGTLLSLSVLGVASRADEQREAASESVFGRFVGSSPCGESIRALLRIPADADLIQWKLTLFQDPKTRAPAGYKLHCDYGKIVAGTPGIGKAKASVKREGPWKIAKGTKSAPDAIVFELAGAVALVKVNHDILHVMNPDRSLMVGNGGWSYTLNRAESAEKPGDPDLAVNTPSQSYTISPVATGATVFGVFEGRSPWLGIARELKLTEHVGGIKAKWRVTLYHNPDTQAPTTYKVEGSLHRKGAREGKWTIQRGNETDRNAIVYCLAPTATAPALYLLKGDDNVLFFLDQKQKPLVGHADFSYTLNRRATDTAASRRVQSRP